VPPLACLPCLDQDMVLKKLIFIIGGVREVVIHAPLRFAEAPTVGWSNLLMCIYIPREDA
jgi:hypothetical protein